jgi:adenylate cyclase
LPPESTAGITPGEIETSGPSSAQAFAGKIVLIGATAKGLGDVFPSPYAPAVPSVERHATLIANMLGTDFPRHDNRTAALDAVAIFFGALGIGIAAQRGVLAGGLVAAAFLLAAALGDQLAFDRFGLWLNFTSKRSR